jgi:hypothetical protein
MVCHFTSFIHDLDENAIRIAEETNHVIFSLDLGHNGSLFAGLPAYPVRRQVFVIRPARYGLLQAVLA